MSRVARIYLLVPTTVVVLPNTRIPLTGGTGVTATRAGRSVSGSVTTGGAQPLLTFAQSIGGGRWRIDSP